MPTQIEQAQFLRRLAIRDEPVVVMATTLLDGIAEAPVVEPDRVPEGDPKDRNGPGKKQQGDPGGIGDQQDRHARQRQAVLGEAAHPLQQHHGAALRFHLGPVEPIVEGGRIVKTEIRGQGLVVNQAGHVILDTLTLDGADPLHGGAQDLLADQQRRENGERKQDDRRP